MTGGAKMTAGGTATLVPSNVPGVPTAGVGAVALNLTLAHTDAPGFATVWPAGPIPNVSSVNAHRADQVVANHVVASLDAGSFKVFTHMGSHVIADVFGYWTLDGAPGPGGGGNVTNPPGGGTGSTPPAYGPHAFLYLMGDDPTGAHARWNPCRVLDYQLNAASASPSQLAALAQAITAVEYASGLDLVQVGTTTGGLDGNAPDGARAVIVLATPAQAPLVASGGYGGGIWSDGEVVSGKAMVSTLASPDIFMNVLLHELGHMVGLAHVTDTAHIMNPTARGLRKYAAGDREGMWGIGAAQGCVGARMSALSDVAALDVPQERYMTACGGEMMHPVFAGVEVFTLAEPQDAHGSDSLIKDEVCVRMPVPSP